MAEKYAQTCVTKVTITTKVIHDRGSDWAKLFWATQLVNTQASINGDIDGQQQSQTINNITSKHNAFVLTSIWLITKCS